MNQEMREELRSRMYNALADVAFDMENEEGVSVTEKDMQESFEWFLIHFFEDVE